jgi:hypothetical protein
MMRISRSDLTQGVQSTGLSNAPRPSAAEAESQPLQQTTDLLAISAAATAASSNAERTSQLKLQVDSGAYYPPAAGIARKLISGALTRLG